LLTCLEPRLFSAIIKRRRDHLPPELRAPYHPEGVRKAGSRASSRGTYWSLRTSRRRRDRGGAVPATKHASVGRLAAGVFPMRSGTPGFDLLPGAGTAVRGRVVLPQGFAQYHPSAREPHSPDRRNLGDFARLYPRQRVPTDLKDILQNTIDLCAVRQRTSRRSRSGPMCGTPIRSSSIPDQMQQVFSTFC